MLPAVCCRPKCFNILALPFTFQPQFPLFCLNISRQSRNKYIFNLEELTKNRQGETLSVTDKLTSFEEYIYMNIADVLFIYKELLGTLLAGPQGLAVT